MNGFRDRPAGTLRLNVPVSVARLDVLAAGWDVGIRYAERLEQDMVAVPFGPRVQRFATAAAPVYLARHGRPGHPRDLLGDACLRDRFASGAMTPWEFERDGEVVRVDPAGPLLVRVGTATDLAVDAAIAGTRSPHAPPQGRDSRREPQDSAGPQPRGVHVA